MERETRRVAFQSWHHRREVGGGRTAALSGPPGGPTKQAIGGPAVARPATEETVASCSNSAGMSSALDRLCDLDFLAGVPTRLWTYSMGDDGVRVLVSPPVGAPAQLLDAVLVSALGLQVAGFRDVSQSSKFEPIRRRLAGHLRSAAATGSEAARRSAAGPDCRRDFVIAQCQVPSKQRGGRVCGRVPAPAPAIRRSGRRGACHPRPTDAGGGGPRGSDRMP